MGSTTATTSLLGELEGWIDIIRRGDDLTCFGKTKGGERCHNTLSQDTCTKLVILFKDGATLLRGSKNGLEQLLEEASSLVMCIRYHQNQSNAKLKEWLEMVSNTASQCGLQMSSNVPSESTTPALDQHIPSSEKNQTKIIDTSDIPSVIEELDLQCSKPPLEPDVNDSGIESEQDETLFIAPIVDSREVRVVPRTPKKFIQPASTDSGISMSYDAHVEPYIRTTEDRETPESPLTKKSKARQAATKNELARPAATPIQPMPLSIRPKPSFAPFENPFIKMRTYISKPLGKSDLKEGYIYGFQIDGCPYTKIGKSAIRKEKTKEVSLAERLKEHKRSHSPPRSDLITVLKIPVLFVGRIENLVKIHLAAGRMREKYSCKDPKDETLNIEKSHIEWFNISLDEIWTVVMAWQHWILTKPYVKRDTDLHHLNPEWKSHLEEIGVLQTGRDVWLDWLCRHVPEMPMVIKDALKSRELSRNNRTAESRDSFMRSSASGFKTEINRVRTNLL